MGGFYGLLGLVLKWLQSIVTTGRDIIDFTLFIDEVKPLDLHVLEVKIVPLFIDQVVDFSVER